MPRLVRRKGTMQRIKDYLNPGDFILWLSEEIETSDWISKQLATPLALGLHFVFLIARANSGNSGTIQGDDVFGDVVFGSGWLSYICTFIVYLLTAFSVANAAYAFTRKRHYRLFESSVETPQSTPSAYRVRVDSSPVSSSPLRFLTSILGDRSAESRAHPDPTRDVWELAVWDPIPICLQLFCLFSPGHVLVYWLFLPTISSDPRPSITVFTTIILEILLCSQLLLLETSFSQQEKDTALIHKEVMSEYDTKYVHPRMNPLVRDVGTQFMGPDAETKVGREGDVDTYTPAVVLKRGYRTNPNPNYRKHIDPDNVGGALDRAFPPSPMYTPSAYNSREPTPFTGRTPQTIIRQPKFRQNTSAAVSTGTSTSTGDGGSLGVYNHARSPLKIPTSMYDIQGGARRDTPPKNSFDMAAREIKEQRDRSMSPTKRNIAPRSLLGDGGALDLDRDRRTSAPSAGLPARHGNVVSPYKRYPSRWRSSSFGGFVSKIRPSNRPERGYTLRRGLLEDGRKEDATKPVYRLGEKPLENVTQDRGAAGSRLGMHHAIEDTRKMLPNYTLDGPEMRGNRALYSCRDPFHTHSTVGYTDNSCTGRLRTPERGAQTGSRSVYSHKPGQAGNGGHGIASIGEKKQSTLKRLFSFRKKDTKGEENHLEVPAMQEELQNGTRTTFEGGNSADRSELMATKTQEMFADKKRRREQRRSLKESGDFLGVQGANPRTGYWDISTGTSSSEPSQESEATRRRLREQARQLEDQRARYLEALKAEKSELERVQTARDHKKTEKAEKKRLEVKLKQRQQGRWKPTENGWSSVAEPDLTPIEQSLAGSPVKETAPEDRLFPMPSAANPTPYMQANSSKKHDYFGPNLTNSPLPHVPHVPHVHQNLQVDTVDKSHQASRASDTQLNDTALQNPAREITIRRKSIGSPPRRRRNESSATIIHNKSMYDPIQCSPAVVHESRNSNSPVKMQTPTTESKAPMQPALSPTSSPQPRPFLEIKVDSHRTGDCRENRATVISSQSVSTNQAVNHRQSVQNPEGSNPKQCIIPLDRFPPVTLKNPTAARIPSSSQAPRDTLTLWAPPTTTPTKAGEDPYTIIHTTTTTGCSLLHRPPQFDGALETGRIILETAIPLQCKPSPNSLRVSSHPAMIQSKVQSNESQARPAGTGISSDPQLTPTKQRVARLCHRGSPEGEKVEMKSTPISTSTSPQAAERQKLAAQNAALVAYQHSRHWAAVKRAGGQEGDALTPPKMRRALPRDVHREFQIVPGGRGDIGDPSRTRDEVESNPELLTRRLAAGARAGGPRDRPEDSLVVWAYQAPTHVTRVEKTPMGTGVGGARKEKEHGKGRTTAPAHPKGSSPTKRAPTAGTTARARARAAISREVMLGIVAGTAQAASSWWWWWWSWWWLVSAKPYLDPRSGVRLRWARQQLTGGDLARGATAALLLLLMVAIAVRLVAGAWQTALSLVALLRLVAGL
ncbi:hypothetical protein B7494_g7275 [Chlorociboria aeruginascens]|nr:hypothetical protein B7494_g7275 [Chlorociboria aeruginascens]